MKSVEEVLAAYKELVSRPDATAEGREAFWASLRSSVEDLAEVRRLIESFMSEEGEPPAEDVDDFDLAP